jgi:hypothetical protein
MTTALPRACSGGGAISIHAKLLPDAHPGGGDRAKSEDQPQAKPNLAWRSVVFRLRVRAPRYYGGSGLGLILIIIALILVLLGKL